MPKTLPAKKVIKILCREFGFYFVSQKGSHIKLARDIGDEKIITVVPQHKELAPGTLKSILKLAQIDEEKFLEKI